MKTRLSFANVMSVIAVFIALGGTTYAAVTLPKNSVKAKQIAKNAVGASEIKRSAVRSAEVEDASLLAQDFAAGQLPQGAKGDKGDKGDKGAKGDPGDTGTFGSITTVFERATADLADNTNGNYDVYCPAGQQAVAGGGRGDDTLSEQTILTNTRPAISPSNTEPPLAGQGFTGWRITVVNPTGGAASGIKPEVWAVCVTP
jgi:hypothetical protein